MLRYAGYSIALAALLFGTQTVNAHCQVPCGIYNDQFRFERLLEDTATVAKGMAQITELSANDDALSQNQLTRWVITKEDHASNIQQIVAEYFLAQRIKSDNEKYVDQLKAAHAVTVAAMKCKQTVDPANAKALEAAIFDLYRAYTGKDPHIHEEE